MDRKTGKIRKAGKTGNIRNTGKNGNVRDIRNIRNAGKNRDIRNIGRTLQELLYPPRCPICDEVLDIKGKRCCPSCAEALPWVGETACMKCGGPLEDERQEYCGECRTQKHFYDRGAAAFIYTGALRHSVYRMKSANRRDYIPFFAEAMAGRLGRYLPQWRPEVILPVPMHPRKRRARGYNQSELLAEEIGRLTGIPVKKDLLYCTRAVHSQKTLSRKERLTNLRGSFAVRGDFPVFRRVLLVDDVYTTGSTVDEISRVLRESGAESVFFVVLCAGKGKKTVCTLKKV